MSNARLLTTVLLVSILPVIAISMAGAIPRGYRIASVCMSLMWGIMLTLLCRSKNARTGQTRMSEPRRADKQAA